LGGGDWVKGRKSPLGDLGVLYPNGLSPNGLWKGESFFLFVPPRGSGGLLGTVIIIRVMELSIFSFETDGLIYFFFNPIRSGRII
jgi:hypothetical protein